MVFATRHFLDRLVLMTLPHSHRAYQFGGHSGEDNNQTGWYNRQTDRQTDWWLFELVYV